MQGPQRSSDKIEAVQLVRAIAASVVAIAHQAFGFADHIGEGFGIAPIGGHASQTSVALFFIVSGYIMVVSSRRLFGRAGAMREFWTRRIVRVMPPYWIASLLLAAIFLYLGRTIDPAHLLRSLFLFPSAAGEDATRALPFLWPGWTLFYELLFYALFGIVVGRGRTTAVVGASLGLLVLALVGTLVPADNLILHTFTRPVVLVFIGGMALALMRENGRVLPPVLRMAAGVAAVLAYVMLRRSGAELGFSYVLWSAGPALLLAICLLGGPLPLPFPRLLNGLGDISYALYLLHVPLAWAWIHLYQKAFHPTGPYMFFITLVFATYLASWLFFRFVERPMTRRLNAKFANPRGDDLLQQTGV